MGWGTAKSNLRELFGMRSNCSLSSSNKTGFGGGRVEAGGVMMSVAILVFVVTLCLLF